MFMLLQRKFGNSQPADKPLNTNTDRGQPDATQDYSKTNAARSPTGYIPRFLDSKGEAYSKHQEL